VGHLYRLSVELAVDRSSEDGQGALGFLREARAYKRLLDDDYARRTLLSREEAGVPLDTPGGAVPSYMRLDSEGRGRARTTS
jgi:hypothetical protein